MKATRFLLAIGLFTLSLTSAAQRTIDQKLWPAGAPNDSGDARDTATVRIFLPDAQQATGRAVVICPGGGYQGLAMDHEGYDWAPFFNSKGIAVVVLKYRMPHGHDKVPRTDAEQAIRLVRQNARSWNIRTNEVGIMGSSAGGHLASTVATHAAADAKPDFQILFYPVITMNRASTHLGSHDNLLGKGASKADESEYSNELHVNRTTPRAFIVLCDDDDVVPPSNGIDYYSELFRYDVPAALYVYPSGGHGFGMHTNFRYHTEMLLELSEWLDSF
jgi:acetyl esterase/lipase